MQARQHGDRAGSYFNQSRTAYQMLDKSAASELSRLGKWELESKRLKEAQAGAQIFSGV